MSQEKEWDTTEISLASYLSLELDIEPRYVWEGTTCYFEFDRSPELLTAVVVFVGGDARVEPKLYWLKVSNMKKEMFKANPNSRPARRAASMFGG